MLRRLSAPRLGAGRRLERSGARSLKLRCDLVHDNHLRVRNGKGKQVPAEACPHSSRIPRFDILDRANAVVGEHLAAKGFAARVAGELHDSEPPRECCAQSKMCVRLRSGPPSSSCVARGRRAADVTWAASTTFSSIDAPPRANGKVFQSTFVREFVSSHVPPSQLEVCEWSCRKRSSVECL